MGQLSVALLAAVLIQAAAPTGGQGAQGEKPSPTQQSNQPGTQSKPAATTPESQNAVEKQVEEKLKEALGQGQAELRGGNPNLSPETEKAIESAVENFLADPQIKTAIAEKIHQVTPPGHPEMLAAIFVPISFFGTMALVAWLLYRRSQARMRTRMEFHQQVLSKFSSGQEFAAFLNTPGSQQLLDGVWANRGNPKERLLKHTRLGAIFSVMGLGLLVLSFFDDKDYAFLAVLALGVGIGFLISARVSYRLTEKMGLLRENGPGDVNASGSQP